MCFYLFVLGAYIFFIISINYFTSNAYVSILYSRNISSISQAVSTLLEHYLHQQQAHQCASPHKLLHVTQCSSHVPTCSALTLRNAVTITMTVMTDLMNSAVVCWTLSSAFRLPSLRFCQLLSNVLGNGNALVLWPWCCTFKTPNSQVDMLVKMVDRC